MFKSTMIALALAFAGIAQAATDINFTVTSGGIVTDTDDVIDYANIGYVNSAYGAYRVVVSVNGQAYTGYTDTPETQFKAAASNIVNGIMTYDNSNQIKVSVEWTSRRSCTHSGRGQHCSTFYNVTAGEVLLP